MNVTRAIPQLSPNWQWWGESPDIMQTCLVAGQQMVAIQKSDEEPHLFQLQYLNYESSAFLGMSLAKSRGLEFANAVFAHMSVVAFCGGGKKF